MNEWKHASKLITTTKTASLVQTGSASMAKKEAKIEQPAFVNKTPQGQKKDMQEPM